MNYSQTLAIVFAAIMIGVSAAPTNETLKREEFASVNKRELKARCGSDDSEQHVQAAQNRD